MHIVISEIPIEIQKKSIKNMHLQVKPPDGHVVISAPLDTPDKVIEIYARTNLKWIKDSIKKFQDQPRNASVNMSQVRRCISGENSILSSSFQMSRKIALKFREKRSFCV